MTTDLSNIRTIQDVINVLSVLFFNMNEIERVYYDIFINPVPMDVTLERYNDEGTLETITVPNRAKASFDVLTGEGSPSGIVAASPGGFYLDTAAGDMYYKRAGTDAYGWVKILSSTSMQPGVDYLLPDGDGSQLKNLNMSNVSSGILPVGKGGTGAKDLVGIIKGNGTSAFSTAVEGIDYLGPSSLTGIIAFYPMSNIPTGWLRCDGAAYNRLTYAKLFEKIGTTYGAGDGSTTFNVPNLYNYYIRCWDGNTEFNTVQQPQVGSHAHNFSGETNESGGNHTHTKGDMNIIGNISFNGIDPGTFTGSADGAFSKTNFTAYSGNHGNYANGGITFNFDASRSWTGSTSTASANHSHSFSGTTENNSAEAENRVLCKMLVPVIKF